MTAYSESYVKTLRYLLGLEGGPSNHAWDPGGETAYGIARNKWPQYWENGRPNLEIAMVFYWQEFWVPMRMEMLNRQQVRAEVFEAGVNCGAVNGVRFVQKAYNLLKPEAWVSLVVDGKNGPKTIRAVNLMSSKYEDALLAGCNFFQADYYVRLPYDLKSNALRGWFARRLTWTPTD